MTLPAMRNSFTYIFYVGQTKGQAMSYAEYLKRDDLVAMINGPHYRKVVMGREVFLYHEEELADDKGLRDEMQSLILTMRNNWLRHFCPNSDQQLDFINDTKHDVCGIIAPNRVGKTTVAIAKGLLNGAIPMDPDAPVYKMNGVKWHPYKGANRTDPYKVGVATYQWQLMKNVMWPRLRALIPAHELGIYGGDFAAFGKKRRMEPQWMLNPRIELQCGTIIQFFVYEQDQQVFESDAFDEFWWDEQGKEHLFDAVDERTRTLRGRHLFSLTPHKVEGRPDTGGGGWLEALFSGDATKGHKVKMYGTGLVDVPDWIYPESEKKKAYVKWIDEPTARRDIKTLREGRARILGEWHRTSGLVLDEWDPAVHVVDDFKVPESWTRYRALDHGITNPTVCLWLAVSPPEGDWGSWVVVYRERYSIGKTIGENVAGIIEASGNTRVRVRQIEDHVSGNVMSIWEERQTGEQYAKTVLDSRSFALKDTASGKPHGNIYRMCGLPVQPASGRQSEHWVPLLKELLLVDYDRVPYHGGKPGSARFMVMRSCLNLRREIEGWAWEPSKISISGNLKELPKKKDDHGCTALGYACQIPLRWRGDVYGYLRGDVDKEGRKTTQRWEADDDAEYRGI